MRQHGGAARTGDEMIGWAVRQLAIWGGLGLLLYAFLGDRLSLPLNQATRSGEASPAAASSERPRGAMPNSLTFHANRQGHVELEGAVNGAPVRFMVDTGATVVALTLK